MCCHSSSLLISQSEGAMGSIPHAQQYRQRRGHVPATFSRVTAGSRLYEPALRVVCLVPHGGRPCCRSCPGWSPARAQRPSPTVQRRGLTASGNIRASARDARLECRPLDGVHVGSRIEFARHAVALDDTRGADADLDEIGPGFCQTSLVISAQL